MRVYAQVTLLLALCAWGCREPATADGDHQSEWREVLSRKQAAVAEGATAEEKQRYADSLRAFVQKHPDHSRAAEVWHRMQVEFADELAELGRHREAITFYRSVLTKDPDNEAARKGLALAADRLALSRERLLEIEKGMTQREVAGILGRPMPGWSEKKVRPGAAFEAWYYPTRSGGLAAVYFRAGKVFAAEETSDAPLGRFGG